MEKAGKRIQNLQPIPIIKIVIKLTKARQISQVYINKSIIYVISNYSINIYFDINALFEEVFN